jgi:hypothetical protein
MRTYEYSFQVKNSTQYRLYGIDIQWSVSGERVPIDLEIGATSSVFTISKELFMLNCYTPYDAIMYRIDSASGADTTLLPGQGGYQTIDATDLQTGRVNVIDFYDVANVDRPKFRLNGE